MRIAILSLNNPSIYPALFHLAAELAKAGVQVDFFSRSKPETIADRSVDVRWREIPKVHDAFSRVPLLRSNYHGIFSMLCERRPNWIIAQHEYLLPAIAYKKLYPKNNVKIAAYFSDYYGRNWSVDILKHFAQVLDVYVDVCDMRWQWRKADWPNMRATPFTIRNAPQRQVDLHLAAHRGNVRIVHTGSKMVLDMDRERLSRFVDRLCSSGFSVDWYLPGPPDLRSTARSLTQNPLFSVCNPVNKTELLKTLRAYDVGLFWAPMAECNDNRKSIFLSAASNKIGEYISAGLVVAHTGNPGLRYIPEEACVVFDPTDPEVGADHLARAIADRADVDRKRLAALRYHDTELNVEAQAAPFIRHVLQSGASQAA